MIRGVIIGAALVAAATSGASAEVVFRGTTLITKVTPQCQNTRVGDTSVSRFHPKIAGNANFSGLSFVHQFSAIGYGLDGRSFDATLRAVRSGGVGWGDPYTWNGSKVAVTSSTPPLGQIKPTTRQLLLRGKIVKHDNDPGGAACVVDFAASYVLSD